MKIILYTISSILLLSSLFVIPAYSEKEFNTLTIGFIPVENANELRSKTYDLENYLENYFHNVDIKIVIPTNYEIIIEGLRFGHIDAAFMDASAGWIAHKKSGAEVMFAEVVDGKINYNATVYTTAKNKSIQNIYDTIGKKVAFTSITGSSGFIMPIGKLIQDGYIDIKGNDLVALESVLGNTFDTHIFAGGYKAALKLLLNDHVDVAFASDTSPEKFLTKEEKNQLTMVEMIGSVPSHVFVIRPELPTTIKSILFNSMVNLNYEQNNHILQNIYGADALLPITTSHITKFGEYIDSITTIESEILNKNIK